jgi:hypothetical protein
MRTADMYPSEVFVYCISEIPCYGRHMVVITKLPHFFKFFSLLECSFFPLFFKLFRGHCASCQSSILSRVVFYVKIEMEGLRIKISSQSKRKN